MRRRCVANRNEARYFFDLPVVRRVPLTRLWRDLRSCFLRPLRLSEARKRAVVFRLAFFVVRAIGVVYLRLRRLSNGPPRRVVSYVER